MLNLGHQARFPLEAQAELFIDGDIVVHDLDDDVPVEIELPRQINATHAALAEQPDDLITPKKRPPDHSWPQFRGADPVGTVDPRNGQAGPSKCRSQNLR